MIEQEEMYYRIFVLVGGNRIITKVEDNQWKEPIMIFISQNLIPGNQQGISLIPLIQFADSSVKSVSPIDKTQIWFDYEPEKKLIENYKSVVSKVQAQKAGLII